MLCIVSSSLTVFSVRLFVILYNLRVSAMFGLLQICEHIFLVSNKISRRHTQIDSVVFNELYLHILSSIEFDYNYIICFLNARDYKYKIY